MTPSERELQHEVAWVNGIRMHYVTQGTGELVLLLHGFPEFWYSWRHQIPALATRFRVVAPDLRGYNLTEKPPGVGSYRLDKIVEDIVTLIQALGQERAIIVGHDWGGAAAWMLAMTHPACVRQLIVLNIPHPEAMRRGLRTLRQIRKSWYIFFFQIPWLPEFLFRRNDYRSLEQTLRRMTVRPGTFTDADIEALKEANARPGGLTAEINWYRSLFRSPFLLGQRLRRVEAPTLMIWGENDLAIGNEFSYATEQWVRDFRVHHVPNCGHFVHEEQPEQVNRLILDFLSDI